MSVDLSEAQKAPGVKAALTIVEPNGKVMYQGDEVAGVAAATEEQARDALRLIKVQYDVLAHIATEALALRPDAPAVFEGGNIKEGNTDETGDLDAGFKAAAEIVEATYQTQVQTHVCLETHGCVCEWEGDKLTAWVSTQAVHGSREGFAESLQIPQANIRVICEYMGGGFGSKFGPDVQGVVCAKLAKAAGAAVKLMLDRKEEHLAAGNRPSSVSKIKAGVAADGMLTAFDGESYGTGGASAGAGFPLPYIYTFPNRRRRHRDVFTNAGPARAMRAPGHPQGCFATELLMDELADKVRMDPVEFRIKNLPAEAPNRMWRKVLSNRRREVWLVETACDGGSDPGADQARHGLRREPVGRRRTRHEGTRRNSFRRRRGRALRHAGYRNGHAYRSSPLPQPRRSGCRTRLSRPRSATACIRSVAAAAAARRQHP